MSLGKLRISLVLALSFLSTSGYSLSVNNNWQIELGAEKFSSSKSGGLASANLPPVVSEGQELDDSNTGYRFGVRKNFNLQNGYFTNTGAAISFSSHKHSIDFSNVANAIIKRDSDTRNLLLEQRFGYTFDFGANALGHFFLRPYLGVGFNIQQTETTSTATINGSDSPERPNSTTTDAFLVPSIGLEFFINEKFALQLNFSQSRITTPDASIVTGQIEINEGFDVVNISSLSLLYSF